MEQATNPGTEARTNKSLTNIGLLGLVTGFIVIVGFFAFRLVYSPNETGSTIKGNPITAEQLAADHGLQVHLIGVTAGGGMIDFRLKILDPQKARIFLEDPDNLPRLIEAESGVELMAPEGLDDDIEWASEGILFIFYPNDDGVIQSGSPVIVQFNNTYLEPMPAQ